MDDIDNLEAKIDCPECQRKLSIRLRDMRPGNHLDCGCGARLNFTGDDMSRAQEALSKLGKQLERLGAKRR